MFGLVTLLAACGGPAADSGGARPTPWDPSSYVDSPTETSVDPAEVEDAVDDAVASVRGIDARPVFAGYEAAMALAGDGSSGCPTWYETDGNAYWYADCTTPDGATFSGYGFSQVYTDTDLNGDGTLWDLDVLYGSAMVRAPDQTTYELGGAAYVGQGAQTDGGTVFVSVVDGGFGWDATEAAGTWIADGASPALTLYGLRYDDVGGTGLTGRALVAQGTMVTGSGTAAEFDQLAVGNTDIGWPCPGEPGGTMAVRLHDGTWVDVAFDVDTSTWSVDAGACDGCGTASHDGTVVGQVCPDVSPMLDWADQPW